MKKSVLKVITTLCLCSLMFVNVNVLFAFGNPITTDGPPPRDNDGGGCGCIPFPPKTGSTMYGYHNGECKLYDDGTWLDYVPGCVNGGHYCTLTM